MRDVEFYGKKVVAYMNDNNIHEIGMEDLILATGINSYYVLKTIAYSLVRKGFLEQVGKTRWRWKKDEQSNRDKSE